MINVFELMTGFKAGLGTGTRTAPTFATTVAVTVGSPGFGLTTNNVSFKLIKHEAE